MSITRQALPLTAALCLVATLNGQSCSNSLTTTFANNNACRGNMFDVVATNPAGIVVQGLDLNLGAGTWNVEVHAVTGGGSLVGNASNAGAWTLLGTGTAVSNGPGVASVLNLALNVLVPSGTTQGFYVRVTVDTGGPMLYTNGNGQGSLMATNSDLNILEGTGQCSSNSTPFPNPITPRRWNSTVHYGLPGVVPSYQVNQPQANLDIDGIQGNACTPAIVNKNAFTCNPPIPATGTLNFSSNVAGGTFEVAVSTANLATASGGGILLSDGQIVNIDFTQPALFINGGLLPRFDPVPAVPASATFARITPVNVALQAFVTDPSAPLGLRISQGTEIHIAVSPGAPSIPGPTGDDTNVTVNVTAAPTCWTASGLPFHGTTYTQIHVSSNGRVVFVAPDTTFSPTVTSALGNNPFVGLWTDLNPGLGGAITIQNTQPGFVRVDFTGVPYFSQPGTPNSFYIELDETTGVIEFGGLSGVQANPGSANQFLGMSPGGVGGATDPGAVNFSPNGPQVGAGAAGLPTDMLYDFGSSPLSSFTSGLSSLFFVPMPGGNYQWAGI